MAEGLGSEKDLTRCDALSLTESLLPWVIYASSLSEISEILRFTAGAL